jgi:uncharacterized protein (DUF488 family)
MFENLTIWTIGHSNRSIEAFIELLQAHRIELLADIRRFPGSRSQPQFNEGALAESLRGAGIEYVLMTNLGGRRRPRADSHNTAWRSDQFRGYADYMETDEFAQAMTRLVELGKNQRTAIMCSEAVWWRCHRSLVADYLKVRGMEVLHISSAGAAKPHPFTSAATVGGGELSYRGLLDTTVDQASGKAPTDQA